MHNAVRRLVRHGFLEVRKDRGDRRRLQLRPTVAGAVVQKVLDDELRETPQRGTYGHVMPLIMPGEVDVLFEALERSPRLI